MNGTDAEYASSGHLVFAREASLWAAPFDLDSLEVTGEGTADVNVPLELDKLHPAEARAIDRDPTKAPIPVCIFVSYAHDDERQLKRLDLMLAGLEQQHGLVSWQDKRLIAGEEWDTEIRRRLEEMDIFSLYCQRAVACPSIYPGSRTQTC